MKNFIAISLFMLLTMAAQAQGTKNFIDQNYIDVTGKAEMEIAPDQIYIKIDINEKDSKTSVIETESKMIKKLETLGIKIDEQLSILDMGGDLKNFILQKNEVQLSKEYLLLIYDGQTAFSVFKELQSLGISDISIDHVDHSEIISFRKQVRVQAVKAAKEKATYLAEAVDQSIGKVLLIEELNNNLTNPRINNLAMSNVFVRGKISSSSTGTQSLEFEKITLSYSVRCLFELP